METLIQSKNIQIRQQIGDWKEAVTLAAQPLIDHGYIEPSYVQAIFDSTEKFGPYYVLAPEIAMPHASSDSGVNQEQISLLVLKNPIKFSEGGYDVRLIFVLATPNNHAHLEMLKQLSIVFMDEELIARLIEQDDVDSVASLLNNLNVKGE